MFQPFADRVLVRVHAEEEQRDKFGMALPTSAYEVPQTGEVLAVGRGVWQNGIHIPVEAGVGDIVMFSKHGGRKVKIKGEELVIFHESEILGCDLEFCGGVK